ncbi:MAG: GtrA family protein [Bacteroidetes bacterium]|nr:GtrA family protein [Bacteroidota bacterium]
MSISISTKMFRFGLVGISGMVVDFSITWLCKEKLHWNKFISNAAGFSFAVINNFLWNRYWTFHDTTHPLAAQFVSFALVSLAGLAINTALLYMLSRYIKINFYLIKLLVTGLVFLWNYGINLLFTFNGAA